MNQQYSTICEQGDIGLWCNPLDKNDNKAYNESLNTANTKKENLNSIAINEEKKQNKD